MERTTPGGSKRNNSKEAQLFVDLKSALQSGDDESKRLCYENIYLFYADDLEKFLLSKTIPTEIINDIFSETWVITLHNLPNFEWRGISLKTFLFRTAENIIKKYKRNYWEELEIVNQILQIWDQELNDDITQDFWVKKISIYAETELLVENLISCLKPREATVIALMCYAQMTSNEISSHLNNEISPENVRQILHRAKLKLAQIAKKHTQQLSNDKREIIVAQAKELLEDNFRKLL